MTCLFCSLHNPLIMYGLKSTEYTNFSSAKQILPHKHSTKTGEKYTSHFLSINMGYCHWQRTLFFFRAQLIVGAQGTLLASTLTQEFRGILCQSAHETPRPGYAMLLPHSEIYHIGGEFLMVDSLCRVNSFSSRSPAVVPEG